MVFSIKQTLTYYFAGPAAMRAAAAATVAILAGCGAQPLAKPEGHLQPEAASRPSASIPAPVRGVPLPPPPEAREADVKYSVVVTSQPVREVLMAMARETKVNFDIHPGIEGTVNLNAIDQTLKQILTRIAKQVDMRWEMEGDTITVMPDTPYLKNYKVDYVNMSRDVSGTIGVQSNVVAPPSATGTSGASTASSSNQNTSLLKVDNAARNRFWETLERNVKDMLRETDKLLPEGSSETFLAARARNTNIPAAPAPGTTRNANRAIAPVPGDATQTGEYVEQ